MSASTPSPTTWLCPQCGRRVPARVPACRCGAPQPAAVPAPPPAGAPSEGAAPPLPASPRPPAVVLPNRGVAQGFDEDLRSPKEKPLFAIGIAFSSLCWLLLVLSIFGIFYGAIGLAIGLVARAAFLGWVRGNGLRVSGRQLPELHAAVVRSAARLGLAEPPECYVLQAGGSLNAFATRLFGRRFVIVYSDLVDACQDPRQLEFVIAHEVGHLAAGHLKWAGYLLPFNLMPLLGAAYSRACEYTCDRCGLAVVGDLEAAHRGLIVLAAGGRQAARADVAAFMDQGRDAGDLWSAAAELGSSHPFLCKRVAALQDHVAPGSALPAPRNPLAYFLAPFTSVGGAAAGLGSMLVVVAVVGMIAAIAIPSLLRARISANEAVALQTVKAVVAAETEFVRTLGRYDRPDCLVAPRSCYAFYDGPSFLADEHAQPAKNGYRFSFAMSSNQEEFSFRAEPLTPGQTGNKAFCGDWSGSVCVYDPRSVEMPLRAGCEFDRCQILR